MTNPLRITVYQGSELIGEHRFDRDIVKIGRLSSAHLRLEDAKVSRIHAVIEASSAGGDYSVIDMGSSEGTYLNGERVSKERLSDGDELRMGECRLLISFDELSDRPPPPPADDPAPRSEPLWVATPQEMSDAQPTMTLAAASPEAFAGNGHAQPASPQSVAPQQVGYQTPAENWSGAPAPQMHPPMAAGAPVMPAAPSQYPSPQQMAPQQMAPQQMVPQQMAPQQMGHAPGYPSAYPPAGYQEAPSQIPPQAPAGQMQPVAPALPMDPWGSVPNNLASENVPDTDRRLEIKVLWGNTVLDSLTATTQPLITMGDERRITGKGPLQKVIRCDIEVPSKNLPSKTWPFATSLGGEGTTYTLNIPPSFDARLQKADGTVIPLEVLRTGPNAEPGDAGGVRYTLQAAETLYLFNSGLIFQVRYIRPTRLIPPGFMADMNYSWLNILILAFFVHLMAIVSFIATPRTTSDLTEDLFKNPSRIAQFRLTPEEKRKQKNDMLSKLKAGEAGAKARGEEGKAGRKDYKGKKQGRMAVKGDPNDKEIAKSTLNKLFGGKGNVGRSYLFGSGGLGGELKGALGGVTGAEIGDASGLGGLGVRGTGPGGGGLSMNSVGLGALGTRGRGGGSGGYGEGAGGLGKKVERDINISAGSPIIMGSLDKELIRRVIQQHIAQIRYCYEKELVRNPGLFGKVATQFTITADGGVSTAKVDQSTLNNSEVERCITAKIRTWKFPKPKGGGIVIVKYPFIFKTTG